MAAAGVEQGDVVVLSGAGEGQGGGAGADLREDEGKQVITLTWYFIQNEEKVGNVSNRYLCNRLAEGGRRYRRRGERSQDERSMEEGTDTGQPSPMTDRYFFSNLRF